MMVIFTSCVNQLQLQQVYFYGDDNKVVSMQAVRYGEKVKEPKDPEKTGYTFNGWYTSSDFSKKFDFNTKIVGEIHIYAKFDINKYNIHFESNSETVIDDVIVDYGSLLERPEKLEKECYLFDGWYTDQEFNKEYNFDAIVIQDFALYAKWIENHTYDDGVVIKESSCTEKGVRKYTCTICGDTKNEDLALKEHEYDEGVITKEATCTEDGIKKYTCKNCGLEREEKIPEMSATGHNYKGITCTVCGHKIVDSLAELNHEYTDEEGLIVCLNYIIHTSENGYNDYIINYTLENNEYGTRKNKGLFKIIYRISDGSLKTDFVQEGITSGTLYYGESKTSIYRWRLTEDEEFVCIEYVPNSKDPEYIFSENPTDELLTWIMEE